MKKSLAVPLILFVMPVAHAADIEAGKAKVATVCAACHGANGVSVADTIPNLAAQRAGYITAQLKALKDGTRKHDIMNPIAKQLSDDDIANVAAYFSSLPGAAAGAKSDLLPNVAKTNASFPKDEAGFVRYHSVDQAAQKRVVQFYANETAVKAAKEGKPLPEGSVLLSKIYSAKLDADKKPVTSYGKMEPDQLVGYSVMARGAGWGKDIPEMLRNGDWNYATFTPAKEPRPDFNQALCLGCHKPHDDTSYLFTLKQLAEAKAK
jgi:cytochrome c553